MVKCLSSSKAAWYNTIEYNSIYTPIKWGSKKDEQVIDGEGKEYAQWCRTSIGALGIRFRQYVLFEKLITHIRTHYQDSK